MGIVLVATYLHKQGRPIFPYLDDCPFTSWSNQEVHATTTVVLRLSFTRTPSQFRRVQVNTHTNHRICRGRPELSHEDLLISIDCLLWRISLTSFTSDFNSILTGPVGPHGSLHWCHSILMMLSNLVTVNLSQTGTLWTRPLPQDVLTSFTWWNNKDKVLQGSPSFLHYLQRHSSWKPPCWERNTAWWPDSSWLLVPSGIQAAHLPIQTMSSSQRLQTTPTCHLSCTHSDPSTQYDHHLLDKQAERSDIHPTLHPPLELVQQA